MAKYVKYKSKKFPLKKDANAWAQKEKKAMTRVQKIRIDVNYNDGDPMPWEAILLMRN